MRKARQQGQSKKKPIVIGILVLVLVVVAGLFGYQAKLFRDQKRYRRHMISAYKQEDYTKALEYKKDIDKTKNIFSHLISSDVDYYVADCYVKSKEYDKAIAMYDEMIDANADDAKNYTLKAACYMKQDDVKKALETYKTGYDATEDDSLLPNLVYCYMERENYDTAMEYVQKGIDSEDENVKQQLLFDEIVIYEKQTDYKTAYKKAKSYVAAYPDDEDAQKELTFLETR